VARKDVAPVWTRSFPIAKEPTTLGERLKKKRFLAGIRQSEAARMLEVSARSLSLWECDKLFPTVIPGSTVRPSKHSIKVQQKICAVMKVGRTV
jgi:transcriptional regulator with XRE-family HTH domain